MQWTRGIGILQSREFHRSTPSRSGFCPGERPTLGTRCRSRKLLAIHSNCCDKNWCKFSTTQESIIPIFDVLVLLYVEKLLLCIPPYYFSPFIELHCKHSPFFVRRRPHRISKALAYAETVPGVIPFNFVDIALILLLKIWDYFFYKKTCLTFINIVEYHFLMVVAELCLPYLWYPDSPPELAVLARC